MSHPPTRRPSVPGAGADPDRPSRSSSALAPLARSAREWAAGAWDRRRARRAVRRSIFWRLRRVIFLLVLLVIGGMAGGLLVLQNVEVPSRDLDPSQTGFVCLADVPLDQDCGPDNSVTALASDENRVNITYSELPKLVEQAVLAAEDRNYFEHEGVDAAGIARALYYNVRSERVVQGGSTITQQYVKNWLDAIEPGEGRSLMRKIREAAIAVKLEDQFTKQEILERYLNTIYFGRGAYGIASAARAYYGPHKHLDDLSLSEVAYLAGLIRAPSRADAGIPGQLPMALERRAKVLDAMTEERYVTRAQATAAGAEPLEVVPPAIRTTELCAVFCSSDGREYFLDMVRRELIDRFGEDLVYGGGLRVHTTLDPTLQQLAYDTVAQTLPNASDPSASIVAVDRLGRVRAMVGGRDWRTSQVNLATGRLGGGSGRQPGSSFKPFVLAQALRDGYSLRSTLPAPYEATFPGANDSEDWKVRGGGSPSGKWDLVDATRVSSNTAYAQLMLTLGPSKVVDMAAQLGVRSKLPTVPSLVLGSGEVSVLDMASAYSTFANQGVHVEPWIISKVTRADGSVIWEQTLEGERVLSPNIAEQVTYALQGVVTGGTGRNAAIGRRPVAGKTGTTSDNRDAWFVGYTCGEDQLTTAVWMGYAGLPGQTGRTLSDFRGIEVTGGSFPAQMWSRFMRQAVGPDDRCEFPEPSGFEGTPLPTVPIATTATTGTTVGTTDTTVAGSSTSVPGQTTTTPVPPTTPTTAPPTTPTTAPPTTPPPAAPVAPSP